MADAIRCACDAINSAASHLASLRISEIRQSLEFLGVQHTEVLLGLLVFVLMQFTKFAAILILAICLAYGIFYLWDTFFPGIAEFGHRSMKLCRNVRTSANLPPFVYSEGEESLGPGEYELNPTGGYQSGTMLVPMLPDVGKVFRDTSLQTGSKIIGFDRTSWLEPVDRGSRVRGSLRQSETRGKNRQERQERRNRKSMTPEREREREHDLRSHRRSGQGMSQDVKRSNATNVLRMPNATSGGIDPRRLSKITSEDFKRLPNMTSGESRKTHKEESRRLSNVTSAEMSGSRKVAKITSHTNESPRWMNMATEVAESRRRSKSSHPQEGGESRRQSNGQGRGGGGTGESKSRRSPERPYPARGRRPEEQPQRTGNRSGSEENRPTKNRHSLNKNTRSGVIRRQYPDDHFDRLKMENREYHARRMAGNGGGPGVHPTSDGAMLTRQENFEASFKHSDRRETQRSPKSNNPGKDKSNKSRRDGKKKEPMM